MDLKQSVSQSCSVSIYVRKWLAATRCDYALKEYYLQTESGQASKLRFLVQDFSKLQAVSVGSIKVFVAVLIGLSTKDGRQLIDVLTHCCSGLLAPASALMARCYLRK